MKKYIIAYYSRTGASEKAASSLFELLGGESVCDIEEIVDLKDRRGFLGLLSALKGSFSDNITQIEPVDKPPSGYLETVVVTPIWGGKMADAVRTYLAAYKSDIRGLSLVTCANNSTGEQVQKDILLRFAIKTKTLVSLKRRDIISEKAQEALRNAAVEISENTYKSTNIPEGDSENE